MATMWPEDGFCRDRTKQGDKQLSKIHLKRRLGDRLNDEVREIERKDMTQRLITHAVDGLILGNHRNSSDANTRSEENKAARS